MCTEQELLDFMRETAYKPMTYQELEKHFGISDAVEFKSFLRMLTDMEQDGKVIMTRQDRYGVPERMNLLRGRIQAHPKGFAFLIPDEKEHPDLYIHANDMKGTMNGDIVLARVSAKNVTNGKLEGEIVRIVKRAVTQVVGVFNHHESFGFVVPDDKRIQKDIFIRAENFKGAVTGQKVVASVIRYPEGRSAAEGEIIEILGHKDDPGVDILSIIRKHGLPESFPEETMEEAEAAPDAITEEEIQRQGRRDLRNKVIVTIDGEDAKDLDDAVNVELLENGNFLLGVHIADVSYYVREKSKLDEEAYNRGCSVYLVDRVIPMLPHRLSNGICSLNPKVDRLTMSCEMEFEPKTMRRVRHEVFTSVIRTTERMTYTNVRKILNEEDPEVTEKYAGLVDTFKQMRELAMALRGQRMRRGAIDFDFQESKVIVDAEGKPVDIVKRERSIAEQIIEEFMLAANETVAEHFHWLKVPFIYRIHEDPDGEKLMHFMQFAGNFGYAVKGKGNTVHPRALQTLLEEIRGSKEETVISTMMLRSMKQAKYDSESLGHFGLAAEFYTHFTSPIRRYPDLVVHRVMREVLENGGMLPEGRFEALAARMSDIALQSSERERVAVEAERDTEKLKKAEFMLDKIGEEFTGMISGVTSFGMFIELENTVEGLIRLSDLTDDYYHFHELHMALIGERTSKVYRIGDEVKIRVGRVNMDDHTIDFEMVDMKSRSGSRVSLVDARGQGAGGGFKKKNRGAGGFGAAGFGGRGGRGDDRGGGGRGRGGEQRGGGKPGAGGAGRGGKPGEAGGGRGGKAAFGSKPGVGGNAAGGKVGKGGLGGIAGASAGAGGGGGGKPAFEGRPPKGGKNRGANNGGGDSAGNRDILGGDGGSGKFWSNDGPIEVKAAQAHGQEERIRRNPAAAAAAVVAPDAQPTKRRGGKKIDMWGLPVSGIYARDGDDGGDGGDGGKPQGSRRGGGRGGKPGGGKPGGGGQGGQGRKGGAGRSGASSAVQPQSPEAGAVAGADKPKRRKKPTE
ncbi:ribonuclease R [Cohnella yongneupensis]|uniref:Ribonuclease R n=1 Tax=Cohnella yongneupensis TaxID=425006 RepID=A0ABW0R1V6_9BACL